MNQTRDVIHELLQERILLLEAQIVELKSVNLVIFNLPDEGIDLVELEREVILQALGKSRWIQKDAAALLHVSARVMNYRIRVLGIKPGDSQQWARGPRPVLPPVELPRVLLGQNPTIVLPTAVVVPISLEPEVASPPSPYLIYDADGAILAVKSPNNNQQHRKKQKEQMDLIVTALEAYPARQRDVRERLSYVARRTDRLRRKRAFLAMVKVG